MFHKSIEQLDLDDIHSLVTNQVQEGRTLDYKEECHFSDDKNKKEFLSDICSFANAGGGHLVYGIKEKREENKNTGLPEKITGLNNFNSDDINARLESSIRNGIQPRIIGFKLKAIPFNDNKSILVIEIPRSFNSPHMVVFKGSSKFYSRNSAGKYPMDVTEIRNAFLKTESLPKMMNDFRLDRLSAIKNGEIPSPLIPGIPYFVLHIFPIESFLSKNNILDMSKDDHYRLPFIPIGSSGFNPLINFNGLCTSSSISKAYTQIYRDGKIEAVTLYYADTNSLGEKVIWHGYESNFIHFTKAYIEQLESLGVQGPFYIYISLLNIHGFSIHLSWPHEWKGTPIIENELLLPEFEISNGNKITPEIFKSNFDLVWNACGYGESFNFKNGIWEGKIS